MNPSAFAREILCSTEGLHGYERLAAGAKCHKGECTKCGWEVKFTLCEEFSNNDTDLYPVIERTVVPIEYTNKKGEKKQGRSYKQLNVYKTAKAIVATLKELYLVKAERVWGGSMQAYAHKFLSSEFLLLDSTPLNVYTAEVW
jgi:hypothetical protein